MNFWYLAYLDSYLCLLKLERFLNFPWVLSPCTMARKLYPVSKLGKLQYLPDLFPCPQVLLSFITWYLVSWKILFHVFCFVFRCVREEIESGPHSSTWQETYMISTFMGSLIYNLVSLSYYCMTLIELLLTSWNKLGRLPSFTIFWNYLYDREYLFFKE